VWYDPLHADLPLSVSADCDRFKVYLPNIQKPVPPPIPPSELHITASSGTTAPEYVVIQNTGSGAQDMTGWRLVSVVGPQTFNFPAGYVLSPGSSVRIESYTGAVNNPPAVLLWSTGAIWGNSGDKAVLYNAANAAVDSLCYGNACP
jgi:competence protein ComEC